MSSEPRALVETIDDHPRALDHIRVEDHVQRVIIQLNSICKSATLDFALAVGQVIISNFYGGDLDRWRARGTQLGLPLRKLAKHPDLPMSFLALYRSVSIYEICARLGVHDWKHVSTSHIRLVLPLRAAHQSRLLELAESRRWTVRRLDQEIVQLMQHDPGANARPGGRKRPSELRKTVRVLEKLISALSGPLEHVRDTSEPSPESTRAAIDLLRCASERCALLEQRLRNALPGAQTTPPPAGRATVGLGPRKRTPMKARACSTADPMALVSPSEDGSAVPSCGAEPSRAMFASASAPSEAGATRGQDIAIAGKPRRRS
jgi:hypothetical protein